MNTATLLVTAQTASTVVLRTNICTHARIYMLNPELLTSHTVVTVSACHFHVLAIKYNHEIHLTQDTETTYKTQSYSCSHCHTLKHPHCRINHLPVRHWFNPLPHSDTWCENLHISKREFSYSSPTASLCFMVTGEIRANPSSDQWTTVHHWWKQMTTHNLI